MSPKLLSCPDCQKELQKIDYKMWGTKRFNPEMGSYEEDESPGNCDLVFTCPHCEAELDPEAVLA
jgi:rubredoxin